MSWEERKWWMREKSEPWEWEWEWESREKERGVEEENKRRRRRRSCEIKEESRAGSFLVDSICGFGIWENEIFFSFLDFLGNRGGLIVCLCVCVCVCYCCCLRGNRISETKCNWHTWPYGCWPCEVLWTSFWNFLLGHVRDISLFGILNKYMM
ncbi:hypothetical protein TorRG33x02_221570 [Trema orientale]|uniref:Transmembrane protein n=1 Tax=Trema orientale TaxID=63057 RepID=A0A2P5E975_TREOI|nr:hypothetical protein TorRG33x02_221570 [Trema orientale]